MLFAPFASGQRVSLTRLSCEVRIHWSFPHNRQGAGSLEGWIGHLKVSGNHPFDRGPVNTVSDGCGKMLLIESTILCAREN